MNLHLNLRCQQKQNSIFSCNKNSKLKTLEKYQNYSFCHQLLRFRAVVFLRSLYLCCVKYATKKAMHSQRNSY